MTSEDSQFKDTLDVGQTMAAEAMRPGRLLAERYRIEMRLGSGGMGEVWKAIDTELGDMPVAIKILPAILSQHARSITNLKREASIALRLSHPNICRLYNFHSDGDLKFLVMEYLTGQTLEDVLDDTPDHRMSWEQFEPIARQLGEALDHAHSLDPPVLHLDIKPANIMIDPAGQAKLLDFGIAREIRDSVTRVTGRDDTTGTIPYMSPEQFRGDRVGPASDVYSLCCVMYEALTGETFVRASGSLAWQVQEKPFLPVDELPESVNRMLAAGMTKPVAERPVRFAELWSLAGEEAAPVAEPPPPPPPAQAPPPPTPQAPPAPQPQPTAPSRPTAQSLSHGPRLRPAFLPLVPIALLPWALLSGIIGGLWLEWGPQGLFLGQAIGMAITGLTLRFVKLTTWLRVAGAGALLAMLAVLPVVSEYPSMPTVSLFLTLSFLPVMIVLAGARPRFGWAARIITFVGVTAAGWLSLLAIPFVIWFLDDVVDLSMRDVVEPPMGNLVALCHGVVGGALLTLTLFFAIWRASVVSHRAELEG